MLKLQPKGPIWVGREGKGTVTTNSFVMVICTYMYVSLNVNAIERGRHISVPMNRVTAHFLNTVAGTLGTMVKGNSVATNELSHWKVLSRGGGLLHYRGL